jgi:PadR family transcriptional regulator PadR
MGEQLPLVKGTVDMLVLKALTWGPMHGFAISLWLEDRSRGSLGLDDSIMYQVLHRLEERGYVEAEWAVTDNNRRARYYTLTREGRAQLRESTATWLEYSASVTAILTTRSRTA